MGKEESTWTIDTERCFCSFVIRKNREGWNDDAIRLSEKSERGSVLVKCDEVNKTRAVQWNDNKVVSLTSTLGLSGAAETKRRVGSELKTFNTDPNMREHQKFMQGVDRCDQLRGSSGGFAKREHFKK